MFFTFEKSSFRSRVTVRTPTNALCVHLALRATRLSIQSIFTPYFAHVLEDCCEDLEEARLLATSIEATASSKRKRARKDARPYKKKDNTYTPPLDLEEDDEDEDQQGGSEVAAFRFRRSVAARLALSALRRCFRYDRSGFVDKARFEVLLPSIVSQLECGADYSIQDAYPTGKLVGTTEMTSRRLHADELIGPCLAQLASACGKDALWKVIANVVLLRTRSGNSGERVAALVCLKHCFEVVGEEFLALLPECLPFLSELLEVRN